MKKLGLLAMAGVIVMSGCGGDDDEAEDLLREPAGLFFHNQLTDYSGSGTEQADTTVDLIARNNLSDPLFENYPYSTTEQTGKRFKLDRDTETVVFDVNNDSSTLVDDTGISLSAGRNYTLVLMGQLAGAGELVPKLKAYQQTGRTLADSQIRVRFIHALSDASDQALKINVEGDSAVDGLEYAKASSYFTGVPGSETLLSVEVIQSPSGTKVTKTCTISGGNSYDAIITHPAYDSAAVALFCQQVAG